MAKLNYLAGNKQILDNSGDPLAGGKVYFFEPGGSTPLTSYTDSGLGTANAHPLVLDANGRGDAWINADADVQVDDSDDVNIPSLSESNINPAVANQYASKNANVLSKSANYDVTAADDGKLIVASSGTWTLGTAVAGSTLGDGFEFFFFNNGSGTISFNPFGSETVNGASALSVIPKQFIHVRCNGSNFFAMASTIGSITFPATQVPSSDVNTLDDYEEGIDSGWTPKIQDGSFSDSESQTYSIQVGTSLKVGRLVNIWGTLQLSSKGTMSGDVYITNLPFTAKGVSNSNFSINVGKVSNATITAGHVITGYIGTLTSIIKLQLWDSTGGTTDLQMSEIQDTFYIQFSASYTSVD